MRGLAAPLAGAVLGGAAASGCLLVASALDGRRRASLALRLEPYLTASIRQPAPPPWQMRVTRLMGGERDLSAQLVAAGRSESAVAFRARQAVLWLATSGALALLVILVRLAGAEVNVGGGILSAVLLGVAAPVIAQLRVKQDADRRRLAIELELPAVAGLLSLCLVAGETLRSALERVAGSIEGVWAVELRRVRDAVRGGAPLADALDGLRDRIDVVPAVRFVETLQLARERGVPVAAALRAQADDLRGEATRRLIEAAGKRQVLMLAPVVFLILPVCVLFAFWPALVSLRLLSS